MHSFNNRFLYSVLFSVFSQSHIKNNFHFSEIMLVYYTVLFSIQIFFCIFVILFNRVLIFHTKYIEWNDLFKWDIFPFIYMGLWRFYFILRILFMPVSPLSETSDVYAECPTRWWVESGRFYSNVLIVMFSLMNFTILNTMCHSLNVTQSIKHDVKILIKK